MNKVIKKSLTAALLSVFVFSLVFPSGHIIPSTPAIPVANADTCTVGAIGTAIANSVNDIIPSVGEKITYTLNGTISNISDPTAVTVNDALSADLTFVSSTASVGTYSSATGVWDLRNGKQQQHEHAGEPPDFGNGKRRHRRGDHRQRTDDQLFAKRWRELRAKRSDQRLVDDRDRNASATLRRSLNQQNRECDIDDGRKHDDG